MTGSGAAGAAALSGELSASSPSSRTLPVLSKSLMLCRLGGLGGAPAAGSAAADLAAVRLAVAGLAAGLAAAGLAVAGLAVAGLVAAGLAAAA